MLSLSSLLAGFLLLHSLIVSTADYDIRNDPLYKLVKTSKQLEGESIYEFLNRITHGEIYNISAANHEMLEKMGYHYPTLNKSVIPDFNCSTKPFKPYVKATSVHRLTPFDVEIIGAMGDSLTAAFGACAYTLIDLFVECHGVSWSIGGDGNLKKHITLPNILKEYNPKLKGYATGIAPPLIRVKSNYLDVAVSGSTNYDMLDQAKKYVELLVTKSDYDFFGSWKVLTLFVGGNDLCSCCRRYENYIFKYSAKNYLKGVQAALDYLHERVPKLFINLVNAPDVTLLNQLSSLKCDFTHLLECKCGTVFGAAARNLTYQRFQQYHMLYQELVDSGRYDTRDDFTVVLQPFFDKTIIPRLPNGDVDRSFFAPDCFHFSRKSHAASALALWNSMVEPVGNKNKEWVSGESFKCPTENFPYFFTNKNSKEYFEIEDAEKEDQFGFHQKERNGNLFSSIRHTMVRLHTYLVGSTKATKVSKAHWSNHVTGRIYCLDENQMLLFGSITFFLLFLVLITLRMRTVKANQMQKSEKCKETFLH